MPRIRPIKTAEQAAKVPHDQPVEIDLSDEFPQGDQATDERQAQGQGKDQDSGAEEDREEGEQPEPQTLARQAEEVRAAEEARARQAQEAERQRQAEAQRQAHADELARERRAREQSEYDALVNALAAAQSDGDSGKVEYARAAAAGDWQAAAEAQERIADARARVQTLSSGKQALDDQQEEPSQATPQQTQPQQRQWTADDVINSMTGLMPAERDWLKRHPELVTNQQSQTRLQVYYNEATERGLTRGTAEYFDYFNDRFGFNDEDTQMAENGSAPKPRQPSRQVSAPVSRAGTDVKTGKEQVNQGSKIVLTPQQREAAKWSGVDEVTYARNLKRLQDLKKQGYYTES